jgi:hypothetical protein
VRAAERGTVVAAGPDSALPFSRDRSAGGGGLIVTIDHGGSQTLYAHLSAVAVRVGQQVARGTTIGLVGATGMATGPHLHFMVWVNGKPVDPGPYLGLRELPVGGTTMPAREWVVAPDAEGRCPPGYLGVGLIGTDVCVLDPLEAAVPGLSEVSDALNNASQGGREVREWLEQSLPTTLLLVGLIALGVVGLILLAKG